MYVEDSGNSRSYGGAGTLKRRQANIDGIKAILNKNNN